MGRFSFNIIVVSSGSVKPSSHNEDNIFYADFRDGAARPLKICKHRNAARAVHTNYNINKLRADKNFTQYLRALPYLNNLHFLRFGIFFLFEKENACKRKAKQGKSPAPLERRAAVHSLRFSISSSAHSLANSLRSNSASSCGLLCKPFPRRCQIVALTLRRGY